MLKMKIVLVYPPNDMHRVSYNVKTRKHSPYGHQPPLGLGYVAAIAEKAGHEVEIVDGVAKGYNYEECALVIGKSNPDLIGLSVMTHVKDNAYSLSKHLKSILPNTPIVIGGTHSYYFHSDILKECPYVDFVLYGEIEKSLEFFLSLYDKPECWEEINGLCYRKFDGTIQINDPAEIIDDLDEVPFPSWHLFDFSLYKPLPFQFKGSSFFALITSRGCAYGKCAFCYQAGRKKQKYRRHSPDRIVKEISILKKRYGITDIAFWDDTFPTNKQWLRNFRDLLKKESLQIDWTCSTKVNYVTREALHLMKQSGCWSIFFGIESGDEELLKIIDKGITIEQANNAVKWCNELGIETRCAYMLGLPGENPELGRKTIYTAINIDSTYAIFYATHPRYGTKLYEVAVNYGRMLGPEFKGMTGITYVPYGYKDDIELQRMIRNAYTRFYVRPRQILKFVKKIKSLALVGEALFALKLFLGLRN